MSFRRPWNIIVPCGIDRADVAGVVPAAGVERLRRSSPGPCSSPRGSVAAHQHFAALAAGSVLAGLRVDDAHLDARERAPQAPDALLERVLQAARC